jgi:hypothetical protein
MRRFQRSAAKSSRAFYMLWSDLEARRLTALRKSLANGRALRR